VIKCLDTVQIDWDYHMRVARGDPQTPSSSIIHFYHFRHWRLTGVAFEVRDCQYREANRTLLSTAFGRTKEHKDRYASTPVIPATLLDDQTYQT
jgi:hypothetical protein